MISELLFCVCNQIILAGTMILQVIPSMPCEVIELSFGRHHRWLDITLNNYNQKIPIASILVLFCIELLVLFGEIAVRAIRDAEFRKKLGKGTLIGLLVALCFLIIAGVVLFIALFF